MSEKLTSSPLLMALFGAVHMIDINPPEANLPALEEQFGDPFEGLDENQRLELERQFGDPFEGMDENQRLELERRLDALVAEFTFGLDDDGRLLKSPPEKPR